MAEFAGEDAVESLRARAAADAAEIAALKKRVEELELREQLRTSSVSSGEAADGAGGPAPGGGGLPRVESDDAFLPMRRYRSTAPDGRPDAIVVVDPISTGARLAKMALDRGYVAIRLMSDSFPPELIDLIPASCVGLKYEASITHSGDAAATAAALKALPFHVQGVLIGCESGVECCDAVTAAAEGYPTNGTAHSAARRDKYLMGEAVRGAGLRAVRQIEVSDWAAAAPFVAELRVLPRAEAKEAEEVGGHSGWCVLKPTKSAGTDGVYIAKDVEEAQMRFGEIIGAANVFGEANQTVLVQEFLKGTEYVIDSVSYEGEHKAVAVWEYDKRRANGAQFVYFGMRLYQSADGAREAEMTAYVHKVLDALAVRHGPSHAEVMWLDGEDAPCLVEVGCRPHGGEGTFVDMVEPTIGYSKLSVMLDAVEKPYRFHRLPTRPAAFAGGAMEVCLVCYEDGTLLGWPGLDQVKALASFHSLEIKAKVGERITKTVDFLTTPGSVMLVHAERAQVEADAAAIHALEQSGLYKISPRVRVASF